MEQGFEGLDVHIHCCGRLGIGQLLVIGQHDRGALPVGKRGDQRAGERAVLAGFDHSVGKGRLILLLGKLAVGKPPRAAQAINREVGHDPLQPCAEPKPSSFTARRMARGNPRRLAWSAITSRKAPQSRAASRSTHASSSPLPTVCWLREGLPLAFIFAR